MKRYFFVLMVFVLSTSLIGQKRPIAFEDFFSMKRLGSFALSPDGRTIAYDVKVPDIEKNAFKTDIWILDLETEKSLQLTQSEKSSSHPVWSPNGQAIYFNHAGQIWKQAIKSGDAQQVTNFAPGAGNIAINAEGTKLLFAADVDPNCETIDCMEKSFQADQEKTVKAKIVNTLFFRHWNRWLNGKRSHVFKADIDGKNIQDLTPGDYDSPPLDLGSSQDYVFSPDGREVAFVRNMDEIVAASTNNDVFTISLQNGKIKKISSSKGSDSNPVYSPDGKYLAWRSMARAGFESDRNRLMVLDRETGEVVDLTEGFSLSVDEMKWDASNKTIYFKVAEKGNHGIYKVSLERREIISVLKGHFLSGFDLLGANKLLVKKETASMPAELFSYNLKSKKMKQLTHLNDPLLAELDMPALEQFWFTGAKGDKIHGWLLKPPGFDPQKKYPTVQLIHGGPQGAWGDRFHFRWNYQMFTNAGYVVYAINFHGSKSYGQDFTDAVSKDWGGAPYQDLVMGTDYVLKEFPFIDANRLAAAGASYGGFMVNWINGHENPFKCFVSHDGVFDQVSMYGATEELWFAEWEMDGLYWDNPELYHKFSPSRLAKNFKTPTLIIHGELDYRVPYTQGLQMYTALKRQGVDAQLLFFPDEDHFVTKPHNARLWWETVHAWLAKYLKDER